MTTTQAPAADGRLHRLSERAYCAVGRWTWALATTIGFVVFLATVSTAQAERTDEYAEGVDLPDTKPWYSPGDVYDAAEAIGPDGRDSYVEARWTFDVVWPLVYTAFLVVLLSWAFRRAVEPGSRWRLVNLLPVVPLVLDYLENTAASVVMARYPDETAGVVHVLPVLSLLKWTSLSACFVLAVVGGVLTLTRRRRTAAA